jgi:hypothetical protein
MQMNFQNLSYLYLGGVKILLDLRFKRHYKEKIYLWKKMSTKGIRKVNYQDNDGTFSK